MYDRAIRWTNPAILIRLGQARRHDGPSKFDPSSLRNLM